MEVGHQDSGKEASGARGFVAVHVDVLAVVDRSRRHDGDTEELGEEQREDEANEGGEEDFPAALVGRLVDGVVGGVGGPAGREAIYDTAKGEDAAELRSADAHWDVAKVARVSKDAQGDQEDNEGWNPGPELVGMDDLVTEKSDEESAGRNDDDASKAWDTWIHRIDELRSDDDVDRGPANASTQVEDSDCHISV